MVMDLERGVNVELTTIQSPLKEEKEKKEEGG